MNELLRHIVNAYNENKGNFLIELRNIFYNNEYSINDRTRVDVRGYFDENELCPYIQFNIETDEVSHSTMFYRYDFSQTNRMTIDELDVFANNENIVTALFLTSADLE